MKSFIPALVFCFLCPLFLWADYNVLVIGSSKSFSDTNEPKVVREAAFPPAAIAISLQAMLKADTRIKGNVKVVVEDVYRDKDLATGVGQRAPKPWQMKFRCYSLAQYYFWPEGRDARVKKLRGQAGTKWDAVVIMGDPYLIANMPGIYAEGVELISKDVIAGGAKPVLLMQWPKGDAQLNHFVEVVSRVGRDQSITVAPAAMAWSGLRTKSPEAGAKVAAASIYSVLGKRSAGSDAVATAAWNAAKRGLPVYSKKYAFETPFTMKYVSKRAISMHQTGSSSERGITNGLKRVLAKARVSLVGKPKDQKKFDFNLGRGNSNFEPNKQYKVDPSKYGRSYGFPMGERRDLSKGDGKGAVVSTPYGIDKRYLGGRQYEDGTDLGIAYDMIRQGEVPKDVRCIPIRLLYSKLHAIDDGITPNSDGWHMSHYTDTACGAYLYTLLSGRCPVGDEPAKDNQKEWRHWLGRKIGYETAWRMSHLDSRVPGFEVLPSATNAKTVSSNKTEKLTVRFIYPPTAPVTVQVAVDKSAHGSLSTRELTFTPDNYNKAQSITLTGGSAGALNVLFRTKSADPVYNGLTDGWAYAAQ